MERSVAIEAYWKVPGRLFGIEHAAAWHGKTMYVPTAFSFLLLYLTTYFYILHEIYINLKYNKYKGFVDGGIFWGLCQP